MQFSMPSVVAAATTDVPTTGAPSVPPVLAVATPVPTSSQSPTPFPITAAPVSSHPTTAVCKAETNECGAGKPCSDGSCCSQYGVSYSCTFHPLLYTHVEHC